MKNSKLSKLIKISLLGVIGFVIMLIEFPLPIFPNFLKIDFSDLTAVIGGFAMGPIAGIGIELIKNLLALSKTGTAGVGEAANFLIGSSMVLISSLIYKHKKTKMNAVIGLALGTIAMSVAGCLLNYFVLLPMYETALHFPIKAVVAATHVVNPYVTDLKSFILFAIVPFNIIKGAVISVVTMAVYKKISPVVHKEIEENAVVYNKVVK
ncbi:ECF transporter S component [Clostridium neuense]|uniref:Riboflavin transporter n=1 Tax=Clostridium neuense TaxID=1728934 RepID=A0ABW8TD82_9CLOT